MGPISCSAFATIENMVGVEDTSSVVLLHPFCTVASVMVRIPWEPFSCSFQGS